MAKRAAPKESKHRREWIGVGLLLGSVLGGLALISPLIRDGNNWIGSIGDLLFRAGFFVFGHAAPGVVIPALIWAAYCLGLGERRLAIRVSILVTCALVLLPPFVFAAQLGTTPLDPGWVGTQLGPMVHGALGRIGGTLTGGVLATVIVFLIFDWPLGRAIAHSGRGLWATLRGGGRFGRWLSAGVWRQLRRAWEWQYAELVEWREERRAARLSAAEDRALAEAEAQEEAESAEYGATRENTGTFQTDPAASQTETEGLQGEPVSDLPEYVGMVDPPAGEGATEAAIDPDAPLLAPVALLDQPAGGGSGLDPEDLARLGDVLIDKLSTFKVAGDIGGWTTGPVVTQFEIVPAPGVKVGQITARTDDIALALKAPSVRIVAPIPGKGAVGVEVPNPTPEIVRLREVLESTTWRSGESRLPLALGRDLSGRPVYADLARMPHLLIAGQTGSGKSVCINTIITSLVCRYTPSELRLLMIDPKMVELSVYADLPHLRHPVITDNEDASTVLKWAVYEMNRRFALLSANGCRNLEEFNRRVAQEKAVLPKRGVEDEPQPYEEGPLALISLIIDELADLMMTQQSDVETPLARLAQKARAVGIHLVLATQRPSVNVLTGLIKANIPCRIAFRVASKVDSRTILDQNGAESLLGNGDMLFLPPGESNPMRIQGAFVSSEETERILDWYRARATLEAEEEQEGGSLPEPDIIDLMKEIEAEALDSGGGSAGASADRDALFHKAAEIVIANSVGSTSLLQRRLKIGYGRAARIIDQLHEAGVVGPADGSKPREVLGTLADLDASDAGG